MAQTKLQEWGFTEPVNQETRTQLQKYKGLFK